jgi:hypothetical protein
VGTFNVFKSDRFRRGKRGFEIASDPSKIIWDEALSQAAACILLPHCPTCNW